MGNGATVNSGDISTYDNPGSCDVGVKMDLVKKMGYFNTIYQDEISVMAINNRVGHIKKVNEESFINELISIDNIRLTTIALEPSDRCYYSSKIKGFLVQVTIVFPCKIDKDLFLDEYKDKLSALIETKKEANKKQKVSKSVKRFI